MAGVEPDVVVVFESDDGVAADEEAAAGAGAVSIAKLNVSPLIVFGGTRWNADGKTYPLR